MANNKKSFILYCEFVSQFEHLSDKEAGQLIKHIFQYVNDQNPPVLESRVTKIAFEAIKQHLKRDLKKWERYIEKQKENGAKGGRPSSSKPKKPKPFFENPTKPKKADNVNVNVNVNVRSSAVDFEFFRIRAGTNITDDQLDREVQKFRTKYPGVNIKQCGALVQEWISRIVPEMAVVKQMVL